MSRITAGFATHGAPQRGVQIPMSYQQASSRVGEAVEALTKPSAL
jgi:hypothetical protein